MAQVSSYETSATDEAKWPKYPPTTGKGSIWMYWLLGGTVLSFEGQPLTKPHHKLNPKTTPLTRTPNPFRELGLVGPCTENPFTTWGPWLWAKAHFGTADDDEANPNDYGALLVSLSRAYGSRDIAGPTR